MDVYIAADFGRAQDASAIADELERETSARVVSRWHRRPQAAEAEAAARVGGPSDAAVARDAARRNLDDVCACDVFVLLTTGATSRGGRHFETGYALARGKPIVIVGPVEHAFQHLATAVVPDASHLPAALTSAIRP